MTDKPPGGILIRGGTIIPMVRDREFFSGDLLIRDGRIQEIAPSSTIECDPDRVIDAAGAAVLPGFIQAHVHVVQSLLRHQADGLELLDWLRDRTWPYEAAIDGDGVAAAAELGIAELLSGGTTAVLDFGTTHDHDRVFAAARRLGIRFVSGKTHMDIGDQTPPALLEDPQKSLAEAEDLGRRWHGADGGRLRYAVAPRFALSCSHELLQGCADLARRHGWLLQTHASENIQEVEAVRRISGLGNIAFLDDHGLTGRDVVLAHGVHLEAEEIALLAETGTTICHCPGANLKLASGIADVPKLIEGGVRIALGADGPPCNNRLSIFHEMSLAATIHGLRHGPTVLDAWQILSMATRAGAAALHLSDEIGTLETGKSADIAIVDLEEWSGLPGGDPASRIVFGCTAASVRHVLVDGSPVVIDHELVTTETGSLRERVGEAWTATRRRMEEMS